MKKKAFLFCLSVFFVFVSICVSSEFISASAKQKKETPGASLETITLNLENLFDLILDGDKKATLTTLKKTQKNIRKLQEFSSDEKSDFLDTIKEIILLVKSDETDEALDLIDELILDLSDIAEEDEDLSSLETLIGDLESVFDLLDEGDEEAALTTLKNALKAINKIEEFTSEEKSQFSDTINSIIQFVKDDEIGEAFNLLDQILSDFDDASADDEEDDFGPGGGV